MKEPIIFILVTLAVYPFIFSHPHLVNYQLCIHKRFVNKEPCCEIEVRERERTVKQILIGFSECDLGGCVVFFFFFS
jgi:hypothetical protein